MGHELAGSITVRSLVSTRYYFNLTDGVASIRDEEGVEVSDVKAAMVYAMQVIEELRAEDPANSDAWEGWRLEVVDSSGRTVHCIPLNAPSIQ